MLIVGYENVVFTKQGMTLFSHQSAIHKPLPFAAKDVQQLITNYPFTGSGRIKDDRVEHAYVPIVASVFMKLVFDLERIPTEMELWEAYVSTYLKAVPGGYVMLDQVRPKHIPSMVLPSDSLQGRVLRAYPSLIRDVHFFLLCSEYAGFQEVTYDLKTDLKQGIDLMLDYQGTRYGISCFTNTARSESFKHKKYARHDYGMIQEICVRMDLSSGVRAGAFKLFGSAHIQAMLVQMQRSACSDGAGV